MTEEANGNQGVTHFVGDSCKGGHRDDVVHAEQSADKALAADAILHSALIHWKEMDENTELYEKVELLSDMMEAASELY